MRILVLIDAWFPFTGGGQIQIKNLKRILEKKYHCQFFILHSFSANILIRFLWIFWVIPQAIGLHLKHRFDLIHAHAYWAGVPGKIISKILNIPLVFTVHGSNLIDLRIKSLRAFLERIILTKIKYDQVISVSSNFLKYQNANKNIVIIPNGVDINKFKNQSSKIKITDKNSKLIRILYVGRLEKVKGVDHLIKAFAELAKRIKNVNLIIIGKGSQKLSLEELAQTLRIKDKVSFKGELTYGNLIREYLKADLFVLPSLSEGQPLTLLEAWAAKLPVVVTAVGENPRMVKDGYNGYLIKPEDAKVLAAAILKVLNDKNKNLMGKRGYKLVKENYSWQKCAQKTYDIYQKTVKN